MKEEELRETIENTIDKIDQVIVKDVIENENISNEECVSILTSIVFNLSIKLFKTFKKEDSCVSYEDILDKFSTEYDSQTTEHPEVS